MNVLSRDELRALIEKPRGLSVSLYMPTHRAGPETQQDPIRFKNLLQKAEEGLLRSGLRAGEVKGLLEPAQDLLQDALFWRYQGDGLAVFCSQEVFRFYCAPEGFKELVVVTDRFHIKPLLHLFTGDGRFYLLALSQNQVRLFQCARHSASEVDLPEAVPGDISDALRYDAPEKQLQLHTGAPVGKGGGAAIFHGHGAGNKDARKDILQYFRQIDRGLHDIFCQEQAPLVLAGVDYLFSIYREANTYAHLLDDGISGNPEGIKAEDLHRRAWGIVGPYFQEAQQKTAAQYHQSVPVGRTSRNVKAIVSAAYHGRIETLFVAVGLQRWGIFDLETNKVHVRQKPKPGDEDLLDLAAIQTLLHGGAVYAVEPESVPDGPPIAALFRF